MIETRWYVGEIGLAIALLLGSSSAAWPQPAPNRQHDLNAVVPRSQKLLDYFDVAKKDSALGQQYLRNVEAEIASMTPQFEALRQKYGSGLKAFDAGPSKIADRSKMIDNRLSETNSAFQETYSRYRLDAVIFKSIDFGERKLSEDLVFANDILWQGYLWDAVRQLEILRSQYQDKISGIEHSHIPEMDALRRTLRDALAVTDGRDVARWYEDWNYRIYIEGVDRKLQDMAGEAQRSARVKVGAVCRRMNEEASPYVLQFATDVQAIATKLRSARRHVIDGLSQVIRRIEDKKGGAKDEVYASTDRFLAEKAIPMRLNNPIVSPSEGWYGLGHPWIAGVDGDYVGAGGPGTEPCADWREQLPKDIERLFPEVSVQISAGAVGLRLDFKKDEIVQGEAEGRGEYERP